MLGNIPKEAIIIMFISYSVIFGVIAGIGGLIGEITAKHRRQTFRKAYNKSRLIRATVFAVMIFCFMLVVLVSHGVSTVITIQSSGFNPHDITISPGTVTWINNDTKIHHVVSDDGVFDSGNLTPGQSYSYYLNDVRTYPYHDSLDSSMKGTIVLPMSTAGE